MSLNYKLGIIFLFIICWCELHAQWTTVRRAEWQSHLKYIYFLDEQQGIMSNLYEIYTTADADENWVKPFNRQAISMDTLNWYGGIADKIITSSGTTWFLDDYRMLISIDAEAHIDSLPLSMNISKSYTNFYTIDNQMMWLTRDDSTLILSENGGETWELLYKFPSKAIYDLAFLTNQHGYAIVGGGNSFNNTPYPSHIMVTENGGETWEESAQFEPAGFKNNCFVYGENHAWITGSRDYIWYTHNGGATWNYSPGLPDSIKQTCIFFVNENKGWLGGEDGSMLTTVNGGQSWYALPKPTLNQINDIYFLDENKGWVVGNWGFMATTDDGGESWQWLVESTSNILSKVCFVDQNTGFAMGSKSFMSTRDGGKTWDFSTEFNGLNIDFVDEKQGWVGTLDAIYHTQNAGISWEKQTDFDGEYIKCMTFVDENTGWYLGRTGSKKMALFQTQDGGDTWAQVSVISHDANEMDFVSPFLGWIGCDLGVILKTEDGGHTWNEVLTGGANISESISSIDFVDANYGYAIKFGGDFLNTQDGGNTWQHSFPNDVIWGGFMDLQFLDRNEGWIAGMSGVMLHTIDGGLTWDEQYYQPNGDWWADIFFLDKDHGWACGQYGVIAQYVNPELAVAEPEISLPLSCKLYPAWPNPTSNSTQLRFDLPATELIDITIYDIRGRTVRTLKKSIVQAGSHTVQWDGRDALGVKCSNGFYLCRFQAGGQVLSRKITLRR